MIGRIQLVACAIRDSVNLVYSKFHDANDNDDDDTVPIPDAVPIRATTSGFTGNSGTLTADQTEG